MCQFCDDDVPHPVPGDPDVVGQYARAFRDTAAALRDAARDLADLANENITISLAVDEVREKAGEARGRTNQVAIRYEGAASTFSAYAGALREAQNKANGARSNIIENNSDSRWWRHRLRDLEGQQFLNSDPEFLADLAEARRRVATYDGYYGTYSGQYAQALIDRDAAVTTAISGLNDAADNADLEDGFWDGILGDLQLLWELASKYLGPVLEILRDVLEVLKQIVDILALIVTVLSLFLPLLAPLAAALSALSVIMAIAIFACSAILFLMGRETLGRVISDGIGALVGVITSRLGGGSILGDLTEGFTQTANIGLRAALTTSRSVALEMGLAGVDLLGTHVTQVVTDAAVGGIVSSNLTPIGFVVGEGLDFQLGAGNTAWGEQAPPAWNMDGANGTDVLPGVFDIATLGVSGTVGTGVDLAGTIGGGFENLTSDWNETGTVWSSVGVVPAT